MGSIVKIGKVVYVEDENTFGGADAGRIKVFVIGDDNKFKNKELLPWCFPLLPKMFQTTPKIGEMVFVFYAKMDDRDAQRYYIGPVISQPQNMKYDEFNGAQSTLVYGQKAPGVRISSDKDTEGAFPEQDSVAVIGRGQEDIELKFSDQDDNSEVNIRAGIRGQAIGPKHLFVGKDIFFNPKDPAYIQVKRKQGLMTTPKIHGNSAVNVVANHINLMSNLDSTINNDLKDTKHLVDETKMDNIVSNLHPAVKGDKLIEYLELLKGAILHHVHPYHGMEQSGDAHKYIEELQKKNIEDILSDYVHLS